MLIIARIITEGEGGGGGSGDEGVEGKEGRAEAIALTLDWDAPPSKFPGSFDFHFACISHYFLFSFVDVWWASHPG